MPGAFPADDADGPVEEKRFPRAATGRDGDVVVIAVMGETGAGKSSFIKLVTGRNDVKVGETLSSGKSPFRSCKTFRY